MDAGELQVDAGCREGWYAYALWVAVRSGTHKWDPMHMRDGLGTTSMGCGVGCMGLEEEGVYKEASLEGRRTFPPWYRRGIHPDNIITLEQ